MKSLKLFCAISLIFFAAIRAQALSFSTSVPPAIKTQMLDDLLMFQNIQGNNATPLYKSIYSGALNGQRLTQFFNSRIQMVDMNDCGGGPAVACVRPYIDSRIMWLTPFYLGLQIPQVYRLSILIHESRHTEKSNRYWNHVNCPTPFKDIHGDDIRGILSHVLLQGMAACDQTPYGAYGSQAILLKNIELHCSNCTEKMKMDAQIFGDDAMMRLPDARALQELNLDVQNSR